MEINLLWSFFKSEVRDGPRVEIKTTRSRMARIKKEDWIVPKVVLGHGVPIEEWANELMCEAG